MSSFQGGVESANDFELGLASKSRLSQLTLLAFFNL